MSKTVSSDAADPCQLPAEFSSISVIVPAYNEARRLPGTLDTVATYVQTLNLAFVEIIVVDDGSSDGTDEYVRRFAVAHPEVRLVRNPGNRGKGYAVRHGVSEARGVWILMTDADLSSPVEQLIRLAGAAAGETRRLQLVRVLSNGRWSAFVRDCCVSSAVDCSMSVYG